MDKETLSNYGWIVICVLVLAVMIALATPFGNYVKTGVESTRDGLIETGNKGIEVAKLATGTPNNNGGNEPSVPIIRNGVIPDGGTYYIGVTSNKIGDYISATKILNAGDKFPTVVNNGDIYVEGDYEYRHNQYCNGTWFTNMSQNGWGVRVKDNSKTSYGGILSEIAGQPVTNMFGTFYNCTSLTTAPTIPNSVTSMSYTFTYCCSLTTAPTIPSSVTDMGSTFYNCTSLTTAPDMSNANSVTNMSYTFSGCTPLKTYVGSTDTDGNFSNYTIPNSVTDMNGTFRGCTSLTTAPTIPNSVTNMGNTFSGCTSLTTAPTMPNSVTNMGYTFFKCTSLKTYVSSTDTDGNFSNYTIPNSVTNMFGTFQVCTSLTTAPVIPNGVTNIQSTFDGCAALTTAPTIPSGVWNMSYTFRGCASLTTAPVIPSGVTNVFQTFNGCTSLTGSIEVNGNIDISNTYNYGMFIKNSQITEITGSCSNRIKSLLLRTKTEDYPW